MLVPRLLRRAGYTVTAFGNALEAIDHFRKHGDAVDAVVTDMSMPGMSGFDLARTLLAIRPALPVVLVSGFLRPEDQAAATKLGVRDLLLETGTVDELAAALDRIFRGV